jgi:hypothetical protein
MKANNTGSKGQNYENERIINIEIGEKERAQRIKGR